MGREKAPKTGDELLPQLQRGRFIVSRIVGKYEPGICEGDTRQCGCSVSADNRVAGTSTDLIISYYFMDIGL
jgi:hypothetical protein